MTFKIIKNKAGLELVVENKTKHIRMCISFDT